MIALALLAAAPLTCGAVPRPGIAALTEKGEWRGAAVEACRRAATRLGRSGTRFRGYRSVTILRTAARDDIAFLSPTEQRLAVPHHTILVPAIATSAQLLVAKTPRLAGTRPVLCFIIGSAAEDALAAWLDATRQDAIRLGFQEPDEMADGLASGKCAAMAVDAADRSMPVIVVAKLSTLPIDAVTASADAAALSAALRD